MATAWCRVPTGGDPVCARAYPCGCILYALRTTLSTLHTHRVQEDIFFFARSTRSTRKPDDIYVARLTLCTLGFVTALLCICNTGGRCAGQVERL